MSGLARAAAGHLQRLVCLVVVLRCTAVTAQALCSPVFQFAGTIFVHDVKEDLPIGSTITTVQITGTDAQITLQAEPNKHVSFDAASRNITVAESLSGLRQIVIKIICTRIQTNAKVPITVRILIFDVNNNRPKFIKDEYTAKVNELSPVGTTIITGIVAEDADIGNEFITYELQDGQYSDYFDIPIPARGTITLKKPLDFENFRRLTVTIIAKDNQEQSDKVPFVQLNGTTTLVVNVTDGDDLNPKFTNNIYSATIALETAAGEVLRVEPAISAADPDTAIAAGVVYSIVPDPVSGIGDYFTMNPVTGAVTVDRLPPHRGSSLALLIKATQTDNAERYSTALLRILVKSVNTNRPTFLQSEYMADVHENVPSGTSVITVMATDQDKGDALTYRLEQTNAGFRINNGVITTSRDLDYETTQTVRLTAVVSDGSQEDKCTVLINIKNVNDNNPIFTKNLYFLEHDVWQKDANVGSVKATDADTNSMITYSLTDDTNLFTINNRGEILISPKAPASLPSPVFKLLVTATDEASPPRIGSCLVVVKFPSTDGPATPVTGEVKDIPDKPDYVIIIVLGALAGLLLVIIVIMIIYIAKSRLANNSRDPVTRSRSFDGKMNIPGKRVIPNIYDPKGLTYAQKTPSTESNIHLTRENNLATSPQDNPFETGVDNYTYMYTYDHSNSESDSYSPHQEHMRNVNEIEIDTAVAPLDDLDDISDNNSLPPPPQYMNTGPESAPGVPESTPSVSESVANGSAHSSLPSGSTFKAMGGSQGRKAGVSFQDQTDRGSMFNSQNGLTSSLLPQEKPGITVYY